MELRKLFEEDEESWRETMIKYLGKNQLDMLDTVHLKELLEDMGINEKREFKSRFVVLISHLLKLYFQAHMHTRSWDITIKTQRQELKRRFLSGKSKARWVNCFERSKDELFQDALSFAMVETGLMRKDLPTRLPWTLSHILGAKT